MRPTAALLFACATAPAASADIAVWDWSGGGDAPVVVTLKPPAAAAPEPSRGGKPASWLWSETGFVAQEPPEDARHRDLAALDSEIAALVSAHAAGHALDDALLHAIITAESSGNAKAVSPAGAEGLMQLMPATAERFGVADSLDADQNIRGGSAYLRVLLDRYEGDVWKAAAAYNAGEGRVDRGVIPAESRDFATRVVALWINDLRRMAR